MKTTIILWGLLLMLFAFGARAESGLIDVPSAFSVPVTVGRFVGAVEKAGLAVFAHIDHAAAAAEVETDLRPTQLVIFGSPKVGSALMSSDQRIGIDLPLKALVWQDAAGKVWLSYNSPDYLLARFDIKDRAPVKRKITDSLAKLAATATSH